eukprot:73902_1
MGNETSKPAETIQPVEKPFKHIEQLHFADIIEENDDIQEAIVNSTDLRTAVYNSNQKDEQILKCIGYLRTTFKYAQHSYKLQKRGTGTVISVSNDKICYVLTCAHNIRTKVYHCPNCNKYLNLKHDDKNRAYYENHSNCTTTPNPKFIKANKIEFIRCSIHKQYQKKMQNKSDELVIKYGDEEKIYLCNMNTNTSWIDDQKYELYSSTSAGYDIAIISFEDIDGYYKKNIPTKIDVQNGKNTIEKIKQFNIWGYPFDKTGMYGMKSIQTNYQFKQHSKTDQIYLKQEEIDTTAGQSGAVIWTKNGSQFILCGVHTGGSAAKKYNVGTLFNVQNLEQIKNILPQRGGMFSGWGDKLVSGVSNINKIALGVNNMFTIRKNTKQNQEQEHEEQKEEEQKHEEQKQSASTDDKTPLWMDLATKYPDRIPRDSDFYDRDVCFSGNGLVLISDGTRKQICDLQIGDNVRCFPNFVGRIECCIVTNVNREIEMVKLNNYEEESNFCITFEHPILIEMNGKVYDIDVDKFNYINELHSYDVNKCNLKWVLPTQICSKEYKFEEKIYNFVLDSHHTINVNGYWCCTLGHDYKGDVIEHEFWGNSNAIDDFVR